MVDGPTQQTRRHRCAAPLAWFLRRALASELRPAQVGPRTDMETTDHDGSDDIHRKSLRAPIGSHEVIAAQDADRGQTTGMCGTL
jgi:hypothetical protein